MSTPPHCTSPGTVRRALLHLTESCTLAQRRVKESCILPQEEMLSLLLSMVCSRALNTQWKWSLCMTTQPAPLWQEHKLQVWNVNAPITDTPSSYLSCLSLTYFTPHSNHSTHKPPVLSSWTHILHNELVSARSGKQTSWPYWSHWLPCGG